MLNWLLSSSVLIVIVLVLRLLFRGRVSLRLQYALWLPVLLRLLLPFTVGNSPISVLNTLPEELPSPQIRFEVTPVATQGVEKDVAFPLPSASSVPEAPSPAPIVYEKEVELTEILYGIYGCGAGIVGLSFLFIHLQFRFKLHRSRRAFVYPSPRSVYVTDAVETPCLFGLFRPGIYVPSEVAEDPEIMAHCVVHEETHYRHGDHIWAVLRSLSIVIHWYNPLVWLGAVLSGRDAELACDEAAIRRLGEEKREAYGHTLLSLSTKKSKGPFITATTMTGGKKALKERISRIVKKPKMAFYTPVILLLICAVAVGCTFSDGKREKVLDRSELSIEDLIEQNLEGEDVDLPPYDRLRSFFTENLDTANMTMTLEGYVGEEHSTYAVLPWQALEFHCLIREYEFVSPPVLEEGQLWDWPGGPSLVIERKDTGESLTIAMNCGLILHIGRSYEVWLGTEAVNMASDGFSLVLKEESLALEFQQRAQMIYHSGEQPASSFEEVVASDGYIYWLPNVSVPMDRPVSVCPLYGDYFGEREANDPQWVYPDEELQALAADLARGYNLATVSGAMEYAYRLIPYLLEMQILRDGEFLGDGEIYLDSLFPLDNGVCLAGYKTEDYPENYWALPPEERVHARTEGLDGGFYVAFSIEDGHVISLQNAHSGMMQPGEPYGTMEKIKSTKKMISVFLEYEDLTFAEQVLWGGDGYRSVPKDPNTRWDDPNLQASAAEAAEGLVLYRAEDMQMFGQSLGKLIPQKRTLFGKSTLSLYRMTRYADGVWEFRYSDKKDDNNAVTVFVSETDFHIIYILNSTPLELT